MMNEMEMEGEHVFPKNKSEMWRHFSNFKRQYPTFHRQAFASIGGIIGGAGAGMSVAFTSTLLPQIQNQIDLKGSLIVDMNLLSTPIGGFLSGPILLKFGRKATLMYSTVPWILGWIVLSFSSNLTMFLVGSALVGFSSGININACIVYLTEMSEPRLRGFFMALNNSFGYSGGILINHLLGMVFSWQNTLRLSALIPALCLLFASFIPESPYWLIQQNRPEEASISFFWLRGQTSESKNELSTILNKKAEDASANRCAGLLTNICSKMFFVPFFMVAMIITALVGSGIDLIVYYAIDLLSNMSSDLDKNKSLLTIDLLRLVAGIFSCIFIKFSSRRTMYFLSSFSTAVSLIVVAITLKYDLSSTILVICLCIYTTIVNLGLIPVSWPLIAEMFPQVIRDTGSGIALLYLSMFSFLTFEISTIIMKKWSVSMLYCIFAIIVSFCSIILYFIMPETDKCTLQEIEDGITNNNQKSNNVA